MKHPHRELLLVTDYFFFYPPLSHNKVKTLTNSGLASDWRSGLVELDLSNNQLQVVQVVVFTGINNLTRLDLSNNQIHTLSQVVFTHHPISTLQGWGSQEISIWGKVLDSFFEDFKCGNFDRHLSFCRANLVIWPQLIMNIYWELKAKILFIQ